MLKTISLTSLSVALAVMFFTGTATLSTAQAATKYCNGPKITWRVSLWGKRRLRNS